VLRFAVERFAVARFAVERLAVLRLAVERFAVLRLAVLRFAVLRPELRVAVLLFGVAICLLLREVVPWQLTGRSMRVASAVIPQNGRSPFTLNDVWRLHLPSSSVLNVDNFPHSSVMQTT
jgi:hypothetical protein